MESKEFDEGKNLKDCLPGEVFLFAMQGFIHMGDLLLSENPNSKAQYYVEPAKDMLIKLSSMFELDPEYEPYSNERYPQIEFTFTQIVLYVHTLDVVILKD